MCRLDASQPTGVLPLCLVCWIRRPTAPCCLGTSSKLGLVEDGRLLFQGFAGDVVELPTFITEIQVHDLAPVVVRAVVGPREPFVLLGRDVLNLYRILLDGPALAVTIEP
jgi:hypothetical protein